jgi:membrane associated rhomboid family serine protease
VTTALTSESLRPRSIARVIKDHLLLLFGLLGVMWVVEIVDLLPFAHLDRHGIHPRAVSGLPGIVAAPFLHADFGHLMLNSLPFIVLGGAVLLSGVRVFWGVTVFVTLAGGSGVWLFGQKFTNHIGASGLIFGYLGFLLARGFFEKSWSSIVIACVVLIGYGGLIHGVLPLQAGVSWQSHLFGFLAGIAAARLMTRSV